MDFFARLTSGAIVTVRLDRSQDLAGAPRYEVQRSDLALLKSPTRTREGFIRAEGVITRAGIFKEPFKGRIVNEFRPPSEVFSAKSLDSYSLMPLTLDHPNALLTPGNVRALQVGSVGHPQVRGDVATAEILITDADAIAAVEGGKIGLSCGYTSVVYEVPGSYQAPDGTVTRFDTIQTEIVGNHLAIVAAGNAGPDAVIRMDSAAETASAVSIDKAKALLERAENPLNGAKKMKVKIGNAEYEIDDNAAAALQTERFDSAKALQESQAKASALEGQLAVQEAQTEAAKAVSADEAKLAARLELIARCAPVLGKQPAELVRMDSAALMRAVLAVKAPGIALENRDDAFLAGAFETAMQVVRVDTNAQLRGAVGEAKDSAQSAASEPDEVESARLRMINSYQTAWQSKRLSLADTKKGA